MTIRFWSLYFAKVSRSPQARGALLPIGRCGGLRNWHLAAVDGLSSALPGGEAARLPDASAQAIDHRRYGVSRNSAHHEDHERGFSGRVGAGGDAHPLDPRLLHQLIHMGGVHGLGARELLL